MKLTSIASLRKVWKINDHFLGRNDRIDVFLDDFSRYIKEFETQKYQSNAHSKSSKRNLLQIRAKTESYPGRIVLDLRTRTSLLLEKTDSLQHYCWYWWHLGLPVAGRQPRPWTCSCRNSCNIRSRLKRRRRSGLIKRFAFHTISVKAKAQDFRWLT